MPVQTSRFHYSLMVIVFTAVLKLYGITNFTSHYFFAFSDSSCKTRVIFSFLKYFFLVVPCVCVYVCMSVRRFLPSRASKPRNIGTYVFTATRKKIYNRDFR